MTPVERFENARAGCQNQDGRPCAQCTFEALAVALAAERETILTIVRDIWLMEPGPEQRYGNENGYESNWKAACEKIAAAIKSGA